MLLLPNGLAPNGLFPNGFAPKALPAGGLVSPVEPTEKRAGDLDGRSSSFHAGREAPKSLAGDRLGRVGLPAWASCAKEDFGR